MNRRVILHTVGKIIELEAVLLCLPLAVGVYYQNWKDVHAFAVTALLAFLIGFALTLSCRRGDRHIFARGGLVSVALSWISLALT